MTPNVLRLRIGQRLVLAFGHLLAFSLLIAAVAVNRLNDLSDAFTRLVDGQSETREILSDIGANAEDAARKPLVLISVKREQRVLAYTEVDAANRLLDATMRLMDQRLPVGDRRQALFKVQQRLERYRQRCGATVGLSSGPIASRNCARPQHRRDALPVRPGLRRLMALMVTRGIVRPLLRAPVGADQYAQGQHDHRIGPGALGAPVARLVASQ